MQQPSSPLPIENSLNFTYDLFKDLVDSQYTQADALDSKANNIVVAASALLVAGLVLQGAILSLQTHAITLNFTYTRPGLTVLLAVYLVVMLSAIFGGYLIRKLRQIPEPRPFVKQYLRSPETVTKGDTVLTLVDVYELNQSTLRFKVWGIRIASIGLCLEVIGLVVLLLLQIY